MKLNPLSIFVTDDKGIEYLVATKVYIATSYPDLAQGLIGMEDLPMFYGMLLYPCNAIHMRGVKFPIDVLYMDPAMRIVKIVKHINPGEADYGHKNAYYTLELPAGTLNYNPISLRMDPQ